MPPTGKDSGASFNWYIIVGTTSTSVPNSLIFHHVVTNINSQWWFNGVQTNTSADISDVRIKKEIVEIDNAIDKLMLIKPKEYYGCEDKDNNKKYGIVAQDINSETIKASYLYIQ